MDPVLREDGEEEEVGGMAEEEVEMGEGRLGGLMMLGDRSVRAVGSLVLKMEAEPESCGLSAT